MAGLVEQLQTDALDPSIAVDTLLRKVKVAATKLGLDDALDWVSNELGGYSSPDALPDYRKGYGQPVAWNPYHGWQPLFLGGGTIDDIVSTVYLMEPVGAYEKLLTGDTNNLMMPISSNVVAELNRHLNYQVPRMSNNITPGALVGLIQRVRDMVLDWALELARAGVHGDGLSFSENEREKAASAAISIGTFNGSFNTGDAIGANAKIEQSTNLTGQFQSELSNLEKAIKSGVSDAAARAEMLDAMRQMTKAADKPTLVQNYERLLAAGANHMTVLAPFLPALGKMLAG